MGIDVEDITPRIQYVAAVGQTEFDYPFAVFAESDLVVSVDGAPQSLETDYTVELGEDAPGVVTFVEAMTGGEIVTIYRDTAIERITDAQQNGPWTSAGFNNEIDKVFVIMQEQEARVGRALRIPFTAEVDSADIELDPSTFAGKYMSFDSDGKPTPADSLDGGDITQEIVAGALSPRTQAEIDAGVVPSNLIYLSHEQAGGNIYPERYGLAGVTPAVDTLAVQNALLVAAQLTYATVDARTAFTQTAMLTVPVDTRLIVRSMTKGFNGDMVSLGARSWLQDSLLSGDYANYTGRGVIITSGALDRNSWRRIHRCYIVHTASYGVEYTQATAGYGSMISDSFIMPGNVNTPSSVAAVKYPTTEANNGNRTMINVWCFGQPIADCAGTDNLHIVGCTGRYPILTSTSKKVNIVGCRIHSHVASGEDWTIDGVQTNIVGCAVAVPTVRFSATLAKASIKTSFASGTTFVDSSTGANGGNEIDLPRTTYTPTITALSGGFSLGNGTSNGAYRRHGEYVRINGRFVFGSTTNAGTGGYTFSLPYTAATRTTGTAYVRDASTGNIYSATVIVSDGASVANVVVSGTTNSFADTDSPFTWATDDELWFDLDMAIQ